MKITEVYNKSVFKGFLFVLQKEYKNDLNIHYCDSRINRTYELLVSKEYKMLCLIQRHEYLGFCIYKSNKDNSVDIENFLISSPYRGQGVGKQFLTMVEDYLLQLGKTKISLAARPGKEGFYLSCGYTGKGLLQAEFETATKQEIEKFLHQHNIQVLDYKVWDNDVHQFFFDAKEILDNENFIPECRARDFYSQVLFEKELVEVRSITDAQSGGNE